MATAAPASPSPRAISRPRPRDPPVTRATLPERAKSSLLCILKGAILYAPTPGPSAAAARASFMPLRSVDEYLASLRDGRTVFFRGQRVPDVTTHPVIGVAVRHASI